ncbi:alpha/beta fold hydrolase [Alloscardovia macacae]|uniref:Hydrolase n=1 Tax=Alloscardovia macacae TaxID=1160091 RepID=A0A261F045_9BIFI|nr:alpha/beta fold hydrolase [Alloscardovia macacae]OZG52477.1 hydrolase [Alloscardovia macacae]
MATKLTTRLASAMLASAMALSLFAVLPAHAADNDTPPAETPTTTETTTTDPTAPDPISDEDLKKQIQYYAEAFKQADGNYRIGEPLSGGAATGTVPAGLEAYYAQKLTDKKTDEGTTEYSGYLVVPIDYSNTSAGNIALYVTAFPATSQRKGAIVFNNGGPGGSAASYVQNMMRWSEQMKKLNENYDLVGIDPRGVGQSLPFSQCATKEWRDVTAGDPSLYTTDIAKETESNINGTKKYVNSCFEYTGKALGFDAAKRELFLRNVGTTNAARDMDVLRSVLGEEKLNFIGLSYGTRLGYVYAQNFPQNVGRFTLDGALNPFESTAPTQADKTPNLSDEKLRELNAHYLSQGKEFQATYEKFAQWCYSLKGNTKSWKEITDGGISSDEVAVCPLLLDDVQPHEGDLADDTTSLATQQVQNILRPLTTHPLKEVLFPGKSYSFTMSLSFDTAVTALEGGMYSQNSWPTVAYGLQQIHEGKVDSGFTRLYDNARSTGGYGRAPFNTISCADHANPAGASVANYIQVNKMYYAVSPFTDPGAQYHDIGNLYICDAWPFAGSLAAGTPIENLPNVLVVSTRNDPATAYENGEVLAKALFGTELTVEGAQHVAFSRTEPGYECANDIILNHMINGTIPADGQYPPICSVASFRPAAEVPDVPVTPPTNPANKPETGPDVKPENQPSAEKKDEKQVKTAGKSAGKAVKAGSRKLAQTGVNVAALSVVMLMVIASGAVMVTMRRR